MISGNMNKYTKYTVNGKEYASLDEMPEEFKSLFADQNGNGISDSMEQLFEKLKTGRNFSGNLKITQVDGKMKYFLNGKEYDSPDSCPPEFRKIIQDNDGNGIPDVYDSISEKMGGSVEALLNKSSDAEEISCEVDEIGDKADIPRKIAESMLHTQKKEKTEHGSVPEKSSDYGDLGYDYRGNYGRPKSNTLVLVTIAFISGIFLAAAAVVLYLKYLR